MSTKRDTGWQFKVSTALTILMLCLILIYFFQSFIAIREVQPVTVAIERLSKADTTKEK